MLAKGALAASQELPPPQRVAFGHTMLKKLESTNRRFDQEKRYCRIQGLAVAIKGDSGQDRWSKRKVASKVTYRSKPGARVAQFSFATRWLDLSFPHVIGGVQKSTLENRCTGQVPKLSLKPQSGLPYLTCFVCSSLSRPCRVSTSRCIDNFTALRSLVLGSFLFGVATHEVASTSRLLINLPTAPTSAPTLLDHNILTSL